MAEVARATLVEHRGLDPLRADVPGEVILKAFNNAQWAAVGAAFCGSLLTAAYMNWLGQLLPEWSQAPVQAILTLWPLVAAGLAMGLAWKRTLAHWLKLLGRRPAEEPAR